MVFQDIKNLFNRSERKYLYLFPLLPPAIFIPKKTNQFNSYLPPLIEKLLFNNHTAHIFTRQEFLENCSPDQQLEVGTLHSDYKRIILLVSHENQEYWLVGSKELRASRKLTKCIQMANTLISIERNPTQNEELGNYYEQQIVNYSIQDKKYQYFQITSIHLENKEHSKAYQCFLRNCDEIDRVSFEGVNFDFYSIQDFTNFFSELPQTQISALRFKNCQLDDKSVKELTKLLMHNSFLKELTIDNAQITNRCFLDLRSVWQYIPYLRVLKIRNCPGISGSGNMNSFFKGILTELKLQELDLSNNSIDQKIIEPLKQSFFCFAKSTITTFNLSYSKFTPSKHWELFKVYTESPLKTSLRLICQPYPIFDSYFEHFQSMKAAGTQEFDILLKRTPMNHKPVITYLNDKDTSKIVQLNYLITSSIQNESTTIEELHGICESIDKLDYDFPLHYLTDLVEDLRDRVQEAYNQKDFYAFSILYSSIKLIGVQSQDFDPKKHVANNLAESFANDVARIFNLEIPENEINPTLDQLVSRAIINDYRGEAVDLIFMMKEMRDIQALEFQKKQITGDSIEVRASLYEPFYLLQEDPFYMEISQNLKLDKEGSFGSHYLYMDYQRFSEMGKAYLTQMQHSLLVKLDEEPIFPFMRGRRAKFVLNGPKDYCFQLQSCDKLLVVARFVIRMQHRNEILEKMTKSDNELVSQLIEEMESSLENSKACLELDENMKLAITIVTIRACRQKVLHIQSNLQDFKTLINLNDLLIAKGERQEIQDMESPEIRAQEKSDQSIKNTAYFVYKIIIDMICDQLDMNNKLFVKNGISLLYYVSWYIRLTRTNMAIICSQVGQELVPRLQKIFIDGQFRALSQVIKAFLRNILDYEFEAHFSGMNPQIESVTSVFPEKIIQSIVNNQVSLRIFYYKKGLQYLSIKIGLDKTVWDLVEVLRSKSKVTDLKTVQSRLLWLYIDIDDPQYRDIAISKKWKINTLVHYLILLKCSVQTEKLSIKFKQRHWQLDRTVPSSLPGIEDLEPIYEEVKREFLLRDGFAVDYFIKVNAQFTAKLIEKLYFEDLDTPTKLNPEITRRLTLNSLGGICEEALKKYDDDEELIMNGKYILMTRFLIIFKNQPKFCSSVYEALDLRVKIGDELIEEDYIDVVVDFYGLKFSSKKESQILQIFTHQIISVVEKEDDLYVTIEFLDRFKIEVCEVTFQSLYLEQIMDDLLTYCILSLRLPKRVFYAMHYIKIVDIQVNSGEIIMNKRISTAVSDCENILNKFQNSIVETDAFPLDKRTHITFGSLSKTERERRRAQGIEQDFGNGGDGEKDGFYPHKILSALSKVEAARKYYEVMKTNQQKVTIKRLGDFIHGGVKNIQKQNFKKKKPKSSISRESSIWKVNRSNLGLNNMSNNNF